MNFTREPIIETIITPKDGYKLVVRNSKGGSQEEYQVDAVEVVSFGHSFFFRSLERPKSFLVPATDYEVVEAKETRVVLKNASIERSIKIGGGRTAAPPPPQKEVVEESIESEEEMVEGQAEGAAASAGKPDRKRERRRNRRGRRPQEERQPSLEAPKDVQRAAEPVAQGGGTNDETQVSSSMFSSLFPPPSTLISDTISRYKDIEGAIKPKKKDANPVEGDLPPEPIKQVVQEVEAEDLEEEIPSSAQPAGEDEDDYFLI